MTRRPSVASCSRTRRGLGGYLASFADGTFTVDPGAAGRGWFLDRRPYDDVEFGHIQGSQLATGAAAGHYDLLTNISHEIGHLLGRPDVCPERGAR